MKNDEKLAAEIHGLAAEIHGLAADFAGQHFWGKRNAEYYIQVPCFQQLYPHGW